MPQRPGSFGTTPFDPDNEGKQHHGQEFAGTNSAARQRPKPSLRRRDFYTTFCWARDAKNYSRRLWQIIVLFDSQRSGFIIAEGCHLPQPSLDAQALTLVFLSQ